MKQAKYVLDKDYRIGEVDRRLFGSFVEHLRRVVYNGIYEPGHSEADEQGFRKDVIELVRQSNISIVRYPGGNFVSGYNWTDGIGPVKGRKSRLDLAWAATETNEFGIDEFADWAKKTGVEFMASVNLGTDTPKEAGDMIEYCNHPSGSYWSDLRRKYGHEQPHNIKLWCLGNEMDGEWQIGKLSPEDYGKKALETAKIMKRVDPSIELVACGSCCTEVPTYPDWDRIVLEYVYDQVEYISLHRYYSYDSDHHLFYPSADNISDVPYFPVDMHDFIHTVLSAADFVKTKKHSNKNIEISFDEWNVVSSSNPIDVRNERWHTALDSGEDKFNLLDALICGGLLCTLVRNSDRVKIANQSLLVNVGGMISTKKGGLVIKNTTFYPFQHVATYGRGIALLDQVTCHELKTDHHGEVPAMQTASVYNGEDGSINVFILNYDNADNIELTMDFRSFGSVKLVEHVVLDGTDLFAINSFDKPDKVKPRNMKLEGTEGCVTKTILPKMSWNMLRFKCNEK